MEVYTLDLSDRRITLSIKERPDSVIARTDFHPDRMSDFATLKDLLAFCNLWVESLERFEGDGRELIIMRGNKVLSIADDHGNLTRLIKVVIP